MLGRTFVVLAAVLISLAFAVPAQSMMPAQAAFPGANGRIAFVSNRDANDEIYLMNADGSAPANLTNHPAQDAAPAWSPDGTRIAFASDRDGDDDVYVMDAKGGAVTQISNDPAPDFDPAWSPDGDQIVFASTRDHVEPELYVMDASGAGVTRLTNNTVYDVQPAWSANGASIAFERPIFTQVGYIPEVWTMAADGSGVAPLSTSTLDIDPSWSPEGMLAFARIYSPSFNFEVHAGGTRLTNVNGPDLLPAWSPEGDKIAFASARNDPNPDGCAALCALEIYAMNADGSGQMRLTNHSAVDTAPDWQPVVPVGGFAELPSVARTPLAEPETSIWALPAAGAATALMALAALLMVVRRRRA